MSDEPVRCKNHSPIMPPFVPATWRLEVPNFKHPMGLWHTFLCDACVDKEERAWKSRWYTVVKVRL